MNSVNAAMTSKPFFALTLIWSTVLWTLGLALGAASASAKPVEIVGTPPANEAALFREKDRVDLYFMDRSQKALCVQSSTDGGTSWGQPEVIERFAEDVGYSISVIEDRQGGLHLFFLVKRGGGNGTNPGVDLFYEVYHSVRKPGDTTWQPARMIFENYCGSIRRGVCRANGDLVLPLYEMVGRYGQPDYQPSRSFPLVSRDQGVTWQRSPARLTSPIPQHHLSTPYGAVEPSVIELNDGRLWMMIRTQTGYLYESFSTDGLAWTLARPSTFYSSNSPADLLKLRDGRLVMIWNNVQLRPRVGNAIVYNGRDALHAAISADDGKTWQGFREIFRDPTRNQAPPKRGDRGTAYPQAVELSDGAILVVTGQGEAARSLVRFQPDWLMATEAEARLPASLEQWHTWKSLGPVERAWQDRRPVAKLMVLPSDPTQSALAVIKGTTGEENGIAWNFPAAKKGSLTLGLVLTADASATLLLSDCYAEAADPGAAGRAMFVWPVTLTGLGAQPGAPVEVELRWDLAAGECEIRVQGRLLKQKIFQHNESAHGISYLDLRVKTSDEADGFFVTHAAFQQLD